LAAIGGEGKKREIGHSFLVDAEGLLSCQVIEREEKKKKRISVVPEAEGKKKKRGTRLLAIREYRLILVAFSPDKGAQRRVISLGHKMGRKEVGYLPRGVEYNLVPVIREKELYLGGGPHGGYADKYKEEVIVCRKKTPTFIVVRKYKKRKRKNLKRGEGVNLLPEALGSIDFGARGGRKRLTARFGRGLIIQGRNTLRGWR